MPCFAQDEAGACRQRQDLVDMAEIVSVRRACDKVYPELRAATAEAIAPLTREYEACYRFVDRAEAMRSMIESASAKLEAPIGKDPASCTADLPAAASQLLRRLPR